MAIYDNLRNNANADSKLLKELSDAALLERKLEPYNNGYISADEAVKTGVYNVGDSVGFTDIPLESLSPENTTIVTLGNIQIAFDGSTAMIRKIGESWAYFA